MAKDVQILGVEKLRHTLKRTADDISSRQVLGEIGTYLTFSIKDRVQQKSKDVFGRSLSAYAPAYKLWRQENKYGSKVDLTLTGSMFAALTHTTTADAVTIFFMPGEGRTVRPGAKRVQNSAKAFYLQEKRKFFGYTSEDVEKIMRLYNVHLGEALSGG